MTLVVGWKKQMTEPWTTSFVAGRDNLIPSSGLVARYNTTQAQFLTLSGSAITQFLDLSGSGNHTGVQGTAAARPTWTANQFNGQYGAVFDGGDSLALPANMFLLANGDNTYIGISRIDTETGAAQYDWSFTEAGSVRHYSRFSATAGNNLFLNSNTTTGGVSISGNTNTNTTYKAMYRQGTTQAISINGSAWTTNTSGLSENGIDGGTIGSLGASGFLTGKIAEQFWWNRVLTDTEFLQMKLYAAQQYGIVML